MINGKKITASSQVSCVNWVSKGIVQNSRFPFIILSCL
jgi:hypothetical protein